MHHTVAAILQAHRSGTSPEETVARTYARIRRHNDPAIFITLRDEADTIAEAKALAAMRGRDFVTPEDIISVTAPVLRHRLVLTPEKQMEGASADDVITQIVQATEVPR